MAPLPSTDHHSDEEVVGDEHHKGRRKGDGEEDSHLSGVEEGCDVRSRHDHSSREEEAEESVHGSESEGYSHGDGEGACHNHQ